MAEAFLTPVIESLVQLLSNEVKSLTGVCMEVAALKEELELIQSLLKDVGTRSNREELSDALKTWVKQLREVADQTEDIVDEYRRHLTQNTTDKSGFLGFFYKIVQKIKTLKSHYPMTFQICNIHRSLVRIKDRGQGYGLSQSLELRSSSSNTMYVEGHDPRLASLFIEEDEFVDVNSMQQKLIESLIEGESTRMLISLVGQGGIGKTTLAKRVYENEMVKTSFDCCAWITVSQLYNIGELVKKMARQIFPTMASVPSEINMTEELICSLREYLQKKRFLVVVDDVWDTNVWESIKHALPNNRKSSRVIITTRNVAIATNCKEHACDFNYELKIWSQELALELFCKRAFRFESNRHSPVELKQLSHEIVSKCQGLPIVIAAIAGLLSTKEKVEFEWRKVLDNLNSEFETNPKLASISKILSLSYHDLPYHLKPCFLYFGIFPEDHLIDEEVIQRLWITEGFVVERRDKTSKQVAQEYLNELINRNLISLHIKYGLYKCVGVHDLMREMILSMAKESCFFRIMNEDKSRSGGNSRRLSVYGSAKDIVEAVRDIGVRSLFLFNMNELSTSSLAALFKSLKFLKLLDMSYAPLDHLPKEVGNLFHLKYLRLEGTNIKMLPKSIGKLHNLQTLDLSVTSVDKLPKSIAKLQNLQSLILVKTSVRELPFNIKNLKSLRYLVATCMKKDTSEYCVEAIFGVKIHGEVGSLQNLEVLRNVEMLHGTLGFIKDLDKLPNLRELGISELTGETGRAIFGAIEKMSRLERLELMATNEDEILDLQSNNISSSGLHKLFLCCRMERFPNWIPKLWNLQLLDLTYSRLNVDPLKHLQCLPNLTCLSLNGAYDGEQLHFEEGGFRRLKELELIEMKDLNSVKMDHGETTSSLSTLPLLEKLYIGHCPQLKELPSGIQHLKNLKQLKLKEMSMEFVARLQPEKGPDYFKIKHIPSVKFGYLEEGTTRSYKIYKLGQPELLHRIQGHY